MIKGNGGEMFGFGRICWGGEELVMFGGVFFCGFMLFVREKPCQSAVALGIHLSY